MISYSASVQLSTTSAVSYFCAPICVAIVPFNSHFSYWFKRQTKTTEKQLFYTVTEVTLNRLLTFWLETKHVEIKKIQRSDSTFSCQLNGHEEVKRILVARLTLFNPRRHKYLCRALLHALNRPLSTSKAAIIHMRTE